MGVVGARALLIFAMTATLAACGEDPLEPDGTGGLTGQWTFVIDVTVATGACTGEENAPVDTSTVSIVQVGDSVTATGPWGSTSGSETLAGSRSGNTVIFSGAYSEDGGLTIATHTLTITGADQQMTGIENWTWTGPGGSCDGSQSNVTAERQ